MHRIRGHIEAIGARLWDGGGVPGSGRAAVMVGAGFSRNAVQRSAFARHFPDWVEVAAAIVDRLYPQCSFCRCTGSEAKEDQCPVSRKRKRLMQSARETSGALRIADMYEALHGRAALEGVVAERVPFKEYTPGAAHQKLIRLPWADIFTTNWDHLLEHAVDAYDRSYTIVNSPNQIPTARQPRIVKLHGTLEAGSRLIFTDSDFRRYPSESAPFVSTVQQSMMENVFVLVGFSGEDPNFLQWLGWVKDQLGTYLQQIYLVDIQDIDEPERRLLAARGVIPLNIAALAPANDKPASYSGLLEAFFDFLEDQKFEARANLRWPERRMRDIRAKLAGIEKLAGIDMDPAPLLEKWRGRLEEMPPWLVLPATNRDTLRQNFSADIPELLAICAGRSLTRDSSQRLEALGILLRTVALLADRPSRGMRQSIGRILIEGLRATGARVFSRTAAISAMTKLAPVQQTIVTRAICELARSARIDGDGRLQRLLAEFLGDEFFHENYRLYAAIETARHHLGELRPDLALAAIADFDTEAAEPVWQLRKAAILIELELIQNGQALVEDCITQVRRLRYGAGRPQALIWQRSREGWAQFTYRALWSRFPAQLKPRPDDLKIAEIVEELDERLNELRTYDCDPRAEIERCEARLIEAAMSVTLSSWPSSGSSASTKLGIKRLEGNVGHTYLRLLEQAGIAPSLVEHRRNNATTEMASTASLLLWNVAPAAALDCFLRFGRPAERRGVPFDEEPFPFERLLQRIKPDEARALVVKLDERLRNLLRASSGGTIPVSYITRRLDHLLGVFQQMHDEMPDLRESIWDSVLMLHDRRELEALPGVFGRLSRLYEAMFAAAATDDHRCTGLMLDVLRLKLPMRVDQPRGSEPRAGDSWPDPLATLVCRARLPASVAPAGAPPAFEYRPQPLLAAVCSRFDAGHRTDLDRHRRLTKAIREQLHAAHQTATLPDVPGLERRIIVINALLAEGARPATSAKP